MRSNRKVAGVGIASLVAVIVMGALPVFAQATTFPRWGEGTNPTKMLAQGTYKSAFYATETSFGGLVVQPTQGGSLLDSNTVVKCKPTSGTGTITNISVPKNEPSTGKISTISFGSECALLTSNSLLTGCSATVTAVPASLPWSTLLSNSGSAITDTISGIQLKMLFTGSCALAGTFITYTGSQALPMTNNSTALTGASATCSNATIPNTVGGLLSGTATPALSGNDGSKVDLRGVLDLWQASGTTLPTTCSSLGTLLA
jgi:hypothetical protein